jgi:hypothetical protein
MVDERTLLIALGCTLAVGAAVVAYLQVPLQRVLFDICQKSDHARFWTAAANVLLVALPATLVLLLINLPDTKSSPVFWVLEQMKWALLGVVAAVVVVSVGVMMLGRSSSVPVWVSPGDVDDLHRLLGKVKDVRAREELEHSNSV